MLTTSQLERWCVCVRVQVIIETALKWLKVNYCRGRTDQQGPRTASSSGLVLRAVPVSLMRSQPQLFS